VAYALGGQRNKAEEILELYLNKPQETVDLMSLAFLHNALGQTEPAVELIAAAHQQHGPYFPQAILHRNLANLRGHPRVKAIIQEIGLPAE
jgi:hypothetical protein